MKSNLKMHLKDDIQKQPAAVGSGQKEDCEMNAHSVFESKRGLKVTNWPCEKCHRSFRKKRSQEERKLLTEKESSSHILLHMSKTVV